MTKYTITTANRYNTTTAQENHVPQQKRHKKADMAANEQMHNKWCNQWLLIRTCEHIQLKYNYKKHRHMN